MQGLYNNVTYLQASSYQQSGDTMVMCPRVWKTDATEHVFFCLAGMDVAAPYHARLLIFLHNYLL